MSHIYVTIYYPCDIELVLYFSLVRGFSGGRGCTCVRGRACALLPVSEQEECIYNIAGRRCKCEHLKSTKIKIDKK